MSNVTHVLPFGFVSPVMLAPGSTNKVRLAYEIANGLSNTQAEIWGDLQSGSMLVPVVKGSPYGSNGSITTASTEGLKVRVNQLASLDESLEIMAGWIVADVTFTDIPDGFGTIIPEDCFQLVREDYKKQYQLKPRGLRAALVWVILAQGKFRRHFRTRLCYFQAIIWHK